MTDQPFPDQLTSMGGRLFDYGGTKAARDFGDAAAEYRALRESVALFPMTWQGMLRFTGPDRRAWLHGQVTNEVNGLADHAWNEAAIINIQGRMVAMLRVLALPDELLAELPLGIAAATAEHLDRYLIMERVEIEDVSEVYHHFAVEGPRASEAVATVLGAEAAQVQPHQVLRVSRVEGIAALVVGGDQFGRRGYSLIVARESATSVWEQLCSAVRAVGGRPAGWEALNGRRVEAGIPWWGHELDATIIPLEARLERAISMTKGCYVGQEIIARIDARGRVANLLTGLRLAGPPLPEPGATIYGDDKAVGRVTTAIHSPTLDAPIALAFLRREWSEAGRVVSVATVDGRVAAETCVLPFVGSGSGPNTG